VEKWKDAQGRVVNPPIARTPTTGESIHRGRDLFLQSQCIDCHGRLARGDGPAFVSKEVFARVVFGGESPERLDPRTRELWNSSLDEWGHPIRMNDLRSGL
jgi:hypothetical protein